MNIPEKYRVAPVPLGGDREAVAAATLYPNGADPIGLAGCWAVIGPGWAQAALKTAVSVTKVEGQIVDHMAGDMSALRWKPTGEAIVFDAEGRLVDGRKRLLACSLASMPFVSLVLANIDPNSVETSDNLRARRLSDILHIAGEPHYVALATILKLLWRMRDGGYDRTGSLGSDQQLLDMLDRFPDLRGSLAFANGRGRIIRLPLFATMHFLLHRVDDAKAREFFRALLEDGAAVIARKTEKRLRDGHPARMMNDLIMGDRALGHDLDRNRMVGAAALILAWNAFVADLPPKTLRWTPVDEDDVEQPFPAIAGWDAERHALVPPELQIPFQLKRAPGEAAPGKGETAVPGEAADILLDLSRDGLSHPRAGEVWNAAFPSGNAPSVSLRMIGPAQAKQLLDRNTSNRAQVEPIAARYARDMENDEFRSLNGQTVKIADTGRLLDAQHRMKAIVASDACLPFVVVEGLSERVFEAMDRAETKSFKDVLADRNVTNAGTIAAAVRLQFLYELDRFQTRGMSPSNPELSAVLERHPGIMTTQWCNDRGMRKLLMPAVTCWLEYRLNGIDVALAATFLERLATGEQLERGNPILVLRNRLVDLQSERLKARNGTGGGKLKAGATAGGSEHQLRQAAMVTLAWNAWVEGRTISAQALVWRGLEKGGFPELQAPDAQGSLLGDTAAPSRPKPKSRRKAAA